MPQIGSHAKMYALVVCSKYIPLFRGKIKKKKLFRIIGWSESKLENSLIELTGNPQFSDD
jgi:hypothetical protein